MCPLVDERLEDPPAPSAVTTYLPPPGEAPPPPRQRARKANGPSTPTKPGSPRPKPSKARVGTKGAQPRTPRAKPPDLDTRIQVFKEAEGRCCVTGRLLDPLAYPRDWQVVDGELISTAALKVKGEGKGARSWDELRDYLKGKLDAARALEREFGHLYPNHEASLTLFMGGGRLPLDEPTTATF